jgi:hypothetical protein
MGDLTLSMVKTCINRPRVVGPDPLQGGDGNYKGLGSNNDILIISL